MHRRAGRNASQRALLAKNRIAHEQPMLQDDGLDAVDRPVAVVRQQLEVPPALDEGGHCGSTPTPVVEEEHEAFEGASRELGGAKAHMREAVAQPDRRQAAIYHQEFDALECRKRPVERAHRARDQRFANASPAVNYGPLPLPHTRPPPAFSSGSPSLQRTPRQATLATSIAATPNANEAMSARWRPLASCPRRRACTTRGARWLGTACLPRCALCARDAPDAASADRLSLGPEAWPPGRQRGSPPQSPS